MRSELGTERDLSMAELLRQDLDSAARRLFDHEAGVRLGDDPEAVHQARVGIRRLRSTLRTFQVVLDREWSGALRAELAWMAELLGAVRDADVLLERLRHDLGTLLEAMDGRRHAALRDRVAAAVQAPELLPAAEESALQAAIPLVAKRWRRLRRQVRQAGPDPADEQLHQIRIEAKRCRYAAEAVIPVVGDPARAFAKAVAALQEVLGEQHDAVVAQAWLRQAAASTGTRRPEAFVAGQLLATEHARATAARTAWRK